MNLEFLSGLALVIVTIGALAYIVWEYFDIGTRDLKNMPRKFSEVFEKRSSREAKPVNSHLIGEIGTVISHSDDSDRPMRVRLHSESWPARLNTATEGLAPVGASVRVVEVNGPVLIVEASNDEGRRS